MKPAVQVTCPNCHQILRVPPDLGDVALKCKLCNNIIHLRKRTKAESIPAPIVAPFEALGATAPNQSLQTMNSDDRLQGPSGPSVARPQESAADSSFGSVVPAAGTRYSRGRYKGRNDRDSKIKWIAVGSVVFLGAGLLLALVAAPGLFKSKDRDNKEQASAGEDSGKQRSSGGAGKNKHPATIIPNPPKTQPAAAVGVFPRRILAIGISDYMYMNPLSNGGYGGARESDRRDFYKAVDRLRATWKVPADQMFCLTDGLAADSRVDEKHPPMKMVIEGAIDQFLATSRAQDHIVLIFAGHAVEHEGKAYLAPVEGEKDEIATLIPVEAIYAKLAKCPAQEKLVIYDVCRFNPDRGVERPEFGQMNEALEKALHDSPEGVSVWTSCTKNQYAYEFNNIIGNGVRGLSGFSMSGSIFLNMFIAQDFHGPKPSGGLPQPGDALPIGSTSDYVDEQTTAVTAYQSKQTQTPKLTLKPRKTVLAYDSKEAPPKKWEFPSPPPSAKRDEVVSIFDQISLPEIKSVRQDDGRSVRLANNFPFSEESLKDYADSGPKFEDLQKSPEKYAAEFPLRVATVEAIVEMRRLREADSANDLPQEIRGPINEMFKKKITEQYQRAITTRQAILEEQKDKLEAAGKKRDKETSKRWLANYDYALAQTKIRLAYIYEYNLALGKVKLEQLPELDVKLNQIGWRLASVDKMMSPKEIRDMSEEGKNSLSELVKDHPNTPWAVMAKTQRNMVIGIKWQPSNFDIAP